MSRLPAYAAIRGFTLLELLVVVFIMGILAAMFTLSVGTAGGSDREMLREGERLETLIRLALEDAEFQARDLGIRFYPGRYEFSVFDRGVLQDPGDDLWVTIATDVLVPRVMPEAFGFELEIEGRRVNLERSAQDVEKRYEPHIFILSSGDLSDAFRLRIRSREERTGYTLSVAIDGSAELVRDDA